MTLKPINPANKMSKSDASLPSIILDKTIININIKQIIILLPTKSSALVSYFSS